MLFGRLRTVAKRASSLDYSKQMKKLFSKVDVKDEIIRLNTQEQLFEKGENAEGVKLSQIGGEYSPTTVKIKTLKGQPVDRVTLKDRGDFYESFEVRAKSDSFEIVADTVKDTQDLRDRWSDEIIGLSSDSIEDLRVLTNEELTTLFKLYLL